ncbi:MAG: hypothetical protein ACJ8J7_13140 [Sulfurifustaceae bacterium]
MKPEPRTKTRSAIFIVVALVSVSLLAGAMPSCKPKAIVTVKVFR